MLWQARDPGRRRVEPAVELLDRGPRREHARAVRLDLRGALQNLPGFVVAAQVGEQLEGVAHQGRHVARIERLRGLGVGDRVVPAAEPALQRGHGRQHLGVVRQPLPRGLEIL